jgi:prepilin-type N-terminal cleavage/methylation domain-containing protein
MNILKKGFSLMEMVIVMVIAGIIYSSLVYMGSKQKESAIYTSFLNYLYGLNTVGCTKFIQDNNVSYFNNVIYPIDYNLLLLDLKLTDTKYNGVSPNGSPLVFSYKNMICSVSTTIPTEFLDEGNLKFKIVKNIIGVNTNITINSPIELDEETKYNLLQNISMNKGGAFDSINKTDYGNGPLQTIYYLGMNVNKTADDTDPENLNSETYHSLSYSPTNQNWTNGKIPANMGYIY